jgi:anti-sigma B factor antagonist
MGEEDFGLYWAAPVTVTRLSARHAAAVAAEREQAKRLLDTAAAAGKEINNTAAATQVRPDPDLDRRTQKPTAGLQERRRSPLIRGYAQKEAGVIVAPRDFDVYTAGAVRSAAIEAIAVGHHCIVFDLDAACRFIDSTALGTLTGALRRIRAYDGRMAVVCTQEWILRRFEIAGLTEALNIHPTLEDAVASVGQRADA